MIVDPIDAGTSIPVTATPATCAPAPGAEKLITGEQIRTVRDRGGVDWHRQSGLRCVVGVAVVLAGCRPSIADFQARPLRICPETRGEFRWRITGHGMLTADTAAFTPRAVASHDSMPFTATQTTVYTLTVTRWMRSPTFARQEVRMLYPDSPEELVMPTRPLGADSVIARDSTETGQWDPQAAIAGVVNTSGRALRISHAGRSFTVDTGAAPAQTFNGTTRGGIWELKAALQAGEVLGNPQHAPPSALSIDVTLSCGGGGA